MFQNGNHMIVSVCSDYMRKSRFVKKKFFSDHPETPFHSVFYGLKIF